MVKILILFSTVINKLKSDFIKYVAGSCCSCYMDAESNAIIEKSISEGDDDSKPFKPQLIASVTSHTTESAVTEEHIDTPMTNVEKQGLSYFLFYFIFSFQSLINYIIQNNKDDTS